MKDNVRERLEELLKQKAELEQAYQRTIGAISVCQELLNNKEKKKWVQWSFK